MNETGYSWNKLPLWGNWEVPRAARKRTLQGETVAIKASLGHLDLEPLRQRYAHKYYAKFFDLNRWIPFNVRIVRELGLFDKAPVNVLDIGCGGGLLLYCLGYYGHRGIGIDIENPLFADFATALGVDRRISPVKPLRPLKEFSPPGRFDLITLVAPHFDKGRPGVPAWGIKEWRFFFDDVSGRLNHGGRFYVRFSEERSPTVQQALCHGYAPASKHSDRREFIFDHASLHAAVESLEN
jgi:SAM-dependent methyltransferase